MVREGSWPDRIVKIAAAPTQPRLVIVRVRRVPGRRSCARKAEVRETLTEGVTQCLFRMQRFAGMATACRVYGQPPPWQVTTRRPLAGMPATTRVTIAVEETPGAKALVIFTATVGGGAEVAKTAS